MGIIMVGLLEPLAVYTPFLLLGLRVVVGGSFMLHGYPKLGKARQQTIQWLQGLGVPRGVTLAAAVLEFLGGLALIIGFLVPIAAFLIALEMIATTLLKKKKMKGPYLMGHNPAAYEPDITYLLLALVLIFLGAGAFSVDGLLGL